jgi:membrane protein involved in colicin uptake
MGDSGEGLVDAESRIQERMEELQLAREQGKRPRIANPERVRQLESLKLAYKELSRQFEAARHEARKSQLATAMADIERRIAEIGAGPS